MKKVLTSVIALALFAFSALAQTEPVVTETSDGNGRTVNTLTYSKNVLTNDFKYNWELLGAVGTQFFYGDNEKYANFWNLWSPAVDLMLNKWASPSIGFAVGIQGLEMKGLYHASEAGSDIGAHYKWQTSGTPVYGEGGHAMGYYKQKGFFMNPFIVAMFDLSNMIGGVNGDRIYTAQFYAGGGIIVGFDSPNNGNGVTFNTGLINKFRLNERFDFVINLRGALVSDDFDGESRFDEPTSGHVSRNVPFDGQAGVTAGLCLHFGTKKDLHTWKKASESSTDHYYNPVMIPGETIYVRDTVEVNRPVDPQIWFHINFRIDKTNIVDRERINIHSIADFIKTTPDTKYLVCGFADMQTSYPEHNLWLSTHRAQNVYDMLVNEFGVNPDQLVVDYKGGVDYMFYNKEEFSRCVMITPYHE